MDERHHADALDDFLDRLVADNGAHAAGVDGDLAHIARRYRALGSSSAPRDSRERVWQTVRAWTDRSSPGATGPMAHAAGAPLSLSVLPANGLDDLADVGGAPWRQAQTPIPSRRSVVPHLATAAIVLLTLICSFVMLGPRHFWTAVTPAAPAIVSAPQSEMAITTETLVDQSVTSLPVGHAIIGVDRWVLQPSSKPLALPPFGGQAVIAVDMGEVLATLFDAPAAPTELRLEPAETITPASDQDVSLRAAGDNDAVAFVVYASKAFEGQFKEKDPTAHTLDALIATTAERLSGGPGRIVLERLTVPVGTALPQEKVRPFEWIAIGSGVLGLRLEGDGLPISWPSGKEQTFRHGQSLPSVPEGTQMTFRNAGNDPLVLYRLMIVPG